MGEILRLPPLPTIKELLKLYDLRALKHLSQNFLLQPKVIEKIVHSSGGVGDCEVCEVGPGPGGITRSILRNRAKKVLVVEKDERFSPMLEALRHASENRLKIVYADILDFDLSNAFDKSLRKDWEDEPPNIHLIGNLPFSVADVLIFRWLKDISLRRNAWGYGRVRMTLTFQDEVAKRITAQVLSKCRASISVMCQNWCDVTYKYKITGTAFLPKPEVDVGLVHFVPRVKPITDLSFTMVEKVIRTVFNTRQKYCRNGIMRLFPLEVRDELLKELFHLSDLESDLRPFQISNEEFSRLCHAYNEICKRDPRIYNYNYRGPKCSRETDWKTTEVDSEGAE